MVGYLSQLFFARDSTYTRSYLQRRTCPKHLAKLGEYAGLDQVGIEALLAKQHHQRYRHHLQLNKFNIINLSVCSDAKYLGNYTFVIIPTEQVVYSFINI